MNSPTAMLEVRLIRRVHACLTIDVHLRLGSEIGVLFGPSASGKTSILRLITGLLQPEAGSIHLGEATLFDAERGIDLPLRDRRIGMIFQDDLLFPHLSVRQNIGFGLEALRRSDRQARVEQVARLCGVEPLLDRRPESLSGGERQRVGLARALAPRPRLLLCDEPVSALDQAGRQVLLDGLRTIQRSESMPVLYVTHSPAEAIGLGTRLFLLDHGKIRAEGPPLDVLTTTWGGAATHLEGLRNVLSARVEGHIPGHGATRLKLDDGPHLVVPFLECDPLSPVSVDVRSDEIILTRGPIVGLSAQNLIPGTVERVVPHGGEAELLVRSGGVSWIVSVVAPAVEQLQLAPGVSIHMIIKARSCHVRPGPAGIVNSEVTNSRCSSEP